VNGRCARLQTKASVLTARRSHSSSDPMAETSEPPPPGSARRGAHDPEHSFRLLVESVKDYAIFMLDTDGFVRTWNRGAERLKGYRESDIVGRHFSNFYTEEDQRAGKPQHGLGMAVAEGRFEDEGWRVRSDGKLFWADVVITAVYDQDGRHRGFAKVTRDLTERRQAEQERIRLAHAEEAVRLREEFLSIAAHELRTPLNALQLQVTTALQMLEPERAAAYDSAVLARKLSRSRHLTERLGNLIQRLLDMSRLSTGRLVLEKQPMDLVALAKEVIQTFHERAGMKEVEIRFSGPDEANGSWDSLRVEQVMYNLIENALNYGGTPIDVSMKTDHHSVSLDVVDRGPGVSPEVRGRIFLEKFVSAGPVSRGLGLGLFISHKIVEAHGGRIELKDSPDVGGHFRVSLPRRISADDGNDATG
jgi:PAS domain S-box-containing protein